ncbi:MAG: ester cyclase [Actinomycetota bacterium]|nr:ester cyclase [Actinomycetota bacterium]
MPVRLEPGFVEDWSRRYLEAWNAHDGEAVARLCTDDVMWTDPSLPAPQRGRGAVRAFVEATVAAFPDFHVEELEPPLVSHAGPLALSRYLMSGTMLGGFPASSLAATGRRIRVEGVDQWTFRGELMCRYASHYDSLGMARQVGVLPPVGSGADRAMARLQHVQAWFQRRQAAR